MVGLRCTDQPDSGTPSRQTDHAPPWKQGEQPVSDQNCSSDCSQANGVDRTDPTATNIKMVLQWFEKKAPGMDRAKRRTQPGATNQGADAPLHRSEVNGR